MTDDVAELQAERDAWRRVAEACLADLVRLADLRHAERAIARVRALIPIQNPELIDAGYLVEAAELFAILREYDEGIAP